MTRVSASDASQWDAVAEPNLYLSQRWLSSVIRGSQTAAQVLVSSEGHPAAAMFACLLSEPGFVLNDPVALLLDPDYRRGDSTYQTPADRARYAELQASLAADDFYPAAVCVAPVGLTAGIATKGRAAGVGEALIEAFDSIADDWDARTRAILYLDPTAEATVEEALRSRPEFLRTTLDVRTMLRNEEAGLSSYLSALKHTRRKATRKEIQALRNQGLEIAVLTSNEIRPIARQLAVLTAKVQHKYGNPFDPDASHRTLTFLLDNLPDLLRAIVARKDDSVVAFHLVYLHGETMYSAFSGQDYSDLSRRGHAHFNVLFYETLREAARYGMRCIDYGVGVREEHLRRGCTAVPLAGFFKLPRSAGAPARELLALLDRTQRCQVDRAAAHHPYRQR